MTSRETIRIAIADDHPIVVEGLRRLIEQQQDMRVVHELPDGRQALQAVEVGDFEVLVLDLSLPRVSGIEVLRQVSRNRPRIRVVVLSAYPEDQYAQRMAREGAAAYVAKNAHPEELLKAIRVAALGGTYVSPTLQPARRGDEAKAPHTLLSAREYQVFTLLFQGRGVSEIAAELNLAGSTVSNHVARIREKLNVTSIVAIVSYAHSAGLVGHVKAE